jgi:hypothetical protein
MRWSASNRTHAETDTHRVYPTMENGTIELETYASTAQAWTDIDVGTVLTVNGPGVGDAVCMTARPAGLPESSFVQDAVFGAHDDDLAARFGHWWGSQLSLTCDDKWSLFVLAQHVPVRCAASEDGRSVGWECAYDERCGDTADACLRPE